jgi:hypothetical protein
MKPEFCSLYLKKRLLLSGIPGSKQEGRVLAGQKDSSVCLEFFSGVKIAFVWSRMQV